MDALQNYLKPETLEQLQALAKENRSTQAYLTTLQVCALVLKHAKDLGPADADQVDQVCRETVQAINALLPGGYQSLYPVFDYLSGYMAEEYFQRRARVSVRGKTSLLRRLASRIPWMRPR